MSKSSVIIPNEYFETYRGGLRLTKAFFALENKTLFSEKNKEYFINLNQDGKKHIRDLFWCSGFLNKMNIKGDVCITCNNVDNFMFRTRQQKDAEYSEYEGADNFQCENLTIKNPNNTITYSINDSYFASEEASSSNLKSLSFVCNNAILDIVDCSKLESITLEATSKEKDGWNRIVLENLPKLKLLDLSKVNSVKTSAFRFQKVNPNCVLKLNPEMTVNSGYTSAAWSDWIKAMFPEYDNEKEVDYSFKMKEIFPNYNNENPIEVTLKDFHYYIWNYANKRISKDFEKMVLEENKIYEKYDKKNSKTQERIR